jgi:hypothetical protein
MEKKRKYDNLLRINIKKDRIERIKIKENGKKTKYDNLLRGLCVNDS